MDDRVGAALVAGTGIALIGGIAWAGRRGGLLGDFEVKAPSITPERQDDELWFARLEYKKDPIAVHALRFLKQEGIFNADDPHGNFADTVKDLATAISLFYKKNKDVPGFYKTIAISPVRDVSITAPIAARKSISTGGGAKSSEEMAGRIYYEWMEENVNLTGKAAAEAFKEEFERDYDGGRVQAKKYADRANKSWPPSKSA